MNELAVVVDSSSNLDATRVQLRDVFKLQFFTVDQIADIKPEQNVVFDVNLRACTDVRSIKTWLSSRPNGAKVIFAVEKDSWHAQVQAAAFGASKTLERPIPARKLMTELLGDFDSLVGNVGSSSLRSAPAVGQALDALENIFLSAHFGKPIDLPLVDAAGHLLIDSISNSGVSSWVETVRTHHSQTYQHSLLVTGIIVAFAQKLGMSATDQLRLSLAAMLHDIGKARIPVPILEKPAALSEAEWVVMRQHPEHGFEALGSVPEVDKSILDMVVHHHEYLDGSGYPHRLKGGEIPDLVRIVTISDVFAALIERRAYKKTMGCRAAFDILLGMGGKLDADLRREFQFVREIHLN